MYKRKAAAEQGVGYPGYRGLGDDLADEDHSPLPFIAFFTPDIKTVEASNLIVVKLKQVFDY